MPSLTGIMSQVSDLMKDAKVYPTKSTQQAEIGTPEQHEPIHHELDDQHDSKLDIDYEGLPENYPILAQLTAGAFAGIMEHTVMYPVDAIKTRMQTAKLQSSEGLIQCFTRIGSTEGPFALWRGVSSVVIGAGPAHAIYYLVFESTKTFLCSKMQSQTHMKNHIVTDEKHPLMAAISGVAATTASDALMTPFDVVKQRMQIIETKPDIHQMSSLQMAAQIYKKEGVRQFWVSYPTTLMINIPFAAINFGIYEWTSSKLNPGQIYNPLLHCLCGGLSGAVGAAATTPFDCVKTALQTHMFPNATGFCSAITALYNKGGIGAFTRGMKPRVVFNVPSTAISWTAYEMAKRYLLPTY